MEDLFPITTTLVDKQSGGSLVGVVTVGGSPGGICLAALY
jgi:hypothetical protein